MLLRSKQVGGTLVFYVERRPLRRQMMSGVDDDGSTPLARS